MTEYFAHIIRVIRRTAFTGLLAATGSRHAVFTAVPKRQPLKRFGRDALRIYKGRVSKVSRDPLACIVSGSFEPIEANDLK